MKTKQSGTIYRTREQLYALCVLLCWANGLSMSAKSTEESTVTLDAAKDSNMGHSAHCLARNTYVTDVEFEGPESLPYRVVYFKILGVALVVVFDESGNGLVRFSD